MDKEKEAKKRQPNAWIPKLSLFTFNHARIVSLLWVILTVFGIVSYTTLLKREGFPSIDIPYSIGSGTYFVNDASKVDNNVAKKISDIVMQDDRVDKAQTIANASFYTVVVQYKEGTNASQAGSQIQKRVADAGVLPKSATLQFTTPKFGFTERGDDAVISLYSVGAPKTTAELAAEGSKLAEFIKARHISSVSSVSLVDPFLTGTNPLTGQQVTTQTLFDRYGVRQNNQNVFFESVVVGATQKSGADVIDFDKQLRQAVDAYNAGQKGKTTFRAAVSASFATQIKEQIGELQRALLDGLAAVLIIGSIIIAIRASLVIVLAMLTVLSITLGILWLAGATLNTITLFSLILCLALIVDDTIIMIEAIDAQRRRYKDPQQTVAVATRKISRAMVAATLTAVLSFAPLLFISGILGSFIRQIPSTVITSLLVSLGTALVFIPVFARFLLLRPKQMGEKNVHEPAAKIEGKIARLISGPMLWARGSTKKLLGVGLVAVLVGALFIAAAGFFFQKVTFNIFPPTKDSNGLIVQIGFPAGLTINQELAVARKSDKIAADTLGDNFQGASYYATGGSRQATQLFIEITPYDQRDVRSPQLVEQLKKAYAGFSGARITVLQQDVAPPPTPFTARVVTDNREAGLRLANDMQNYLQTAKLVRTSGETAKVVSAAVADPNTYTRANGKLYIEVSATFDGNDTTTLDGLAQAALKNEFTPARLAAYGLPADALQFDLGQEGEFQKSFNSLIYAFPALLLAIYLLLAFQFRSLSQPLLIFLAIPFSLFGITLGLYLSDNAFSFFAMLGFFALIGLSLKNTILLTDYANQQRRAGARVVDAAVEALGERFRPLVATSLTAVVSLTPLAFLSPFWEGLAVVLICGLLSSTFLVILVFPYYYLGVEFLRLRVGRKFGLTWFLISVALIVALVFAGATAVTPLIPFAVALTMWLIVRRLRKRRQA